MFCVLWFRNKPTTVPNIMSINPLDKVWKISHIRKQIYQK